MYQIKLDRPEPYNNPVCVVDCALCNRQLPKHKLSQNAKNLQCLLKFELIEDNVTVFQRP